MYRVMRAQWFARGVLSILALLVVVTGLFVRIPDMASASASTCANSDGATWKQVASPSPGVFDNRLSGVAVLSPCNAWGVGTYFSDAMENNGHTLIERWNGSSWKQAPSPNPGGTSGNNVLLGVSAVSPADAWAVGDYSVSGTVRTLIEHWDGTAWKQVPSPNASSANILTSVVSLSATDVWAVGEYFNSTDVGQTLIERWNGTTWKRVPSPNPGGSSNGNFLFGVAAVSPASAWAVGGYVTGAAHVHKTLILHWNGTAWKQVPSPDPSPTGNLLNGVSVSSATDAWAVGDYFNGAGITQTLTEHWNGTTWKRVPSPNPGGASRFSTFNGVAAVSATGAWAVGDYSSSANADETLIEHWNGAAWKQVPSPDPSPAGNLLNGVAASSATDIWTVGEYSNDLGTGRTLAVHCC